MRIRLNKFYLRKAKISFPLRGLLEALLLERSDEFRSSGFLIMKLTSLSQVEQKAY